MNASEFGRLCIIVDRYLHWVDDDTPVTLAVPVFLQLGKEIWEKISSNGYLAMIKGQP